MHQFNAGEVLIADMTDPDWEPIMKRASAIVTNRGGRTCHAAIIARELGILAVVGTGSATSELQQDGRPVTVSCAEGDTGYVCAGLLDFAIEESEQATMPEIGVKIMMNVGTPDQAFAFSRLSNAGLGWPGWSSSSITRSAFIRRRCSNGICLTSRCTARSVTSLRHTRRRVISLYGGS